MGEYQKILLNFFTDDSKMLKSKLKQILKNLTCFILETDFDGIKEMYTLTKSMKYSGQGYLESLKNFDDEKQKIFDIGYAYALTDFMQMYMDKLYVEKEILNIKTRYKDNVMYILAQQGRLLHKDLAAKLGVSPSGLNAVIKQMNSQPVKLINVEEISKFKIYSLTPVAYQYLVKHNINNFLDKKQKQEEKIHITYKMLETESKETRPTIFNNFIKFDTYLKNTEFDICIKVNSKQSEEQKKTVFLYNSQKMCIAMDNQLKKCANG